MTRWKALEGEKGEIQEIISGTHAILKYFILDGFSQLSCYPTFDKSLDCSCPILSCSISPCPILNYQVPHNHLLSCPVLTYPICLVLSCLPCLVLPCHVLSCLHLSCPTSSYSLSYPALPCPAPLLTVTQKVDLNFIANVRSKIFPALHIGLALELDSDTTITGSCSFRTGTPGADGSPIAVGVRHCVLCVTALRGGLHPANLLITLPTPSPCSLSENDEYRTVGVVSDVERTRLEFSL